MSWLTSTLTNIGGALLGNKLQGNSAKANAELSLENWKYMQSNKHQLEVEDLRKAGLNPILSAGNGSAVSAPSVSGNPESQLGKNIADSITAAKQLKIAEKDANTRLMDAETNLRNAKTQERLAESQSFVNEALIGYYDATSAFQKAKEDETRNNIKIAMEKLPYEIDLLASNAEMNRAAAKLSLASVDLVAAQKDLAIEQKNQIVSDLKDPKKLGSKEFWYNVFNSKEKKWQVIRESYYRGLEHDVLFSFYGDSGKELPIDAEKIATILARGKYITKK